MMNMDNFTQKRGHPSNRGGFSDKLNTAPEAPFPVTADRNGFYADGTCRYTGERVNGRKFNAAGINAETGTEYDASGFTIGNRHRDTGTNLAPGGWDAHGFNDITQSYADEDWYSITGFNGELLHKVTGTKFDEDGYDSVDRFHGIKGEYRGGWTFGDKHSSTGTLFDEDGYDRRGLDAGGFYRSGLHRSTAERWDLDGHDQGGMHKDGYLRGHSPEALAFLNEGYVPDVIPGPDDCDF